MVHRDGNRLAVNRDAGDIVGRIVAVFVIFDFEVLQTDGERQMVKAHVASEILICRYSLTQRHDTLHGCQMRQQGTGKNDQERQMKHHDRRAANLALDKPEDACRRQQSPQSRKPPSTIDVLRDKLRALSVLNDCGGCHDGNHHNI